MSCSNSLICKVHRFQVVEVSERPIEDDDDLSEIGRQIRWGSKRKEERGRDPPGLINECMWTRGRVSQYRICRPNCGRKRAIKWTTANAIGSTKLPQLLQYSNKLTEYGILCIHCTFAHIFSMIADHHLGIGCSLLQRATLVLLQYFTPAGIGRVPVDTGSYCNTSLESSNQAMVLCCHQCASQESVWVRSAQIAVTIDALQMSRG